MFGDLQWSMFNPLDSSFFLNERKGAVSVLAMSLLVFAAPVIITDIVGVIERTTEFVDVYA